MNSDAPAPGASAVSALARTPAVQKSLAFASSVPLPPSPAVVASHIDRQTQKVRSSLNKAYKQSGISDYVDNTRDRISTTASIETLAIIIELWGLQREILPVKYLTIVPASQKLGTPAFPAKIPDLFVLLSADFWSSFLLWLSVSVVMPMTFAYFFNLTLKAKHGGAKNAKALHPATQYDPLTFNISKALITYLIYAKDTTVFGWPGEVSKARIESNVPGGYQGVLIASGIGILASIYEAVLKK